MLWRLSATSSFATIKTFLRSHVDGLMQDCSNSIANALELVQFCTQPPMCTYWVLHIYGLIPLVDDTIIEDIVKRQGRYTEAQQSTKQVQMEPETVSTEEVTT